MASFLQSRHLKVYGLQSRHGAGCGASITHFKLPQQGVFDMLTVVPQYSPSLRQISLWDTTKSTAIKRYLFGFKISHSTLKQAFANQSWLAEHYYIAHDNFEFEKFFCFFFKIAENCGSLSKVLRNSLRKNSLSVKLLARDSTFIENLVS
jgi:hypothetical protein